MKTRTYLKDEEATALNLKLNKKQEKDIVNRKEMNFMKKKLMLCMGKLVFNTIRL